MKQKRADRLASANSEKMGIRCLAWILFCFAMPVFRGVSPDTAGSMTRSFGAIDCISPGSALKICSQTAISENRIPEEEVVRFETGGFLRLGGKRNSHEIYYRIFICGETLFGISRKKCLQSFFETCSLEQPLLFQTLLSATLPVRGSPAA